MFLGFRQTENAAVVKLGMGMSESRDVGQLKKTFDNFMHLSALLENLLQRRVEIVTTEVSIGQKANLQRDSFVQLDNIQTVAKDHFVKYVGVLDRDAMKIVGQKLVLALGLEDCL